MKDIPSTPKIKIPNFLNKIDEKIMIIDKTNYLKVVHKKKNKNYTQIAKELKIPESTYRHYIDGQVKTSLKFLKKLSDSRNLLEKYYKKEIKYSARKNSVNLPKEITPKLAYFIGYLQGDGFLGSDKIRYGFSDEYMEHLKLINKLHKDLFQIEGKIRLKKSKIGKKACPALEVKQYVINSYIHQVFEIPRGYKINLKIPNEFCKNKEILRWYLMGLFDADGTLPKNPKKVKQYFIDIALKDKSFIEEIKKILKIEFNINSLNPYPRKSKSPSLNKICITWELRIRKKDEIRKFLKEIGFYHFNKQKRAKQLLNILGQ